LRKRLTIGQKLSVSFGVVLGLTGLLTYASVDMARGLGKFLDTEINERAKTFDLIASIGLNLREMKEFSRSTQFAYSVSKVLSVNSSHTHNAQTMGECSVCHAFSSVGDSQQGFAKIAQSASASANQLSQLVQGVEARAALGTIRSGIQEWQATFQQYLDLVSKGDFASGHGLVQNSMAPLMEKIDAAANQLEAEQAKLRVSSQASAA